MRNEKDTANNNCKEPFHRNTPFFLHTPLERGAFMDGGGGRFSMIPHCLREMKRHLCVFIIYRSAKMSNLRSMQID
jgi:hypothetical protein